MRIMYDGVPLVTSFKNGTIITALDKDSKIITNIDSVVLL